MRLSKSDWLVYRLAHALVMTINERLTILRVRAYATCCAIRPVRWVMKAVCGVWIYWRKSVLSMG